MLNKSEFLSKCIVFSITLFGLDAHAECSKKAAIKKVNEICQQIEAEGRAAFKKWPNELLFENCGDNYVWIQDTNDEIQMVIHPIHRRLDGTSLKGYEDENKFGIGVEFHQKAKGNPQGAWVDYVWRKPGAIKATSKTSFVKACSMKSGSTWVAGSGVWLEDLRDEK